MTQLTKIRPGSYVEMRNINSNNLVQILLVENTQGRKITCRTTDEGRKTIYKFWKKDGMGIVDTLSYAYKIVPKE